MNYDKTAAYYQFLSRFIFGNTLIEAQVEAINQFPANSSVLIAGGGDGEILKHFIGKNHKIDFVDCSSKMIEIAKSKTKLPLNWYCEDVFDFLPQHSYDVIFFPFLLDNFSDYEVEELILKSKRWLKKSGSYWVVDFTENPNLWQKTLLKAMYLFFKAIAGVVTARIPSIEEAMRFNKFVKVYESSSFSGFIEVKSYSQQ